NRNMLRSAPVAMIAVLAAAPLVAQTMDHSAHDQGPMADYMATMDTMMQSMDRIPTTHDADADFLLMMIPHHQSAVDMALVELEQGDDPATRDMAQRILDAQRQEIEEMKAMLDRMGVDVPSP